MNQGRDKTSLGPAGRHALDGMGERKMSFDRIPGNPTSLGTKPEESPFARKIREGREKGS